MRRIDLYLPAVFTLILSACGGSGSAPPASPAVIAINTAGWADSPYISRDGQRLYFMYSRWNFFPWFTGGSPVLLGPDRVGLHKSAQAFEESDIYVATRQPDGRWSEAVILPFSSTGGDASGMEVGNNFYFVHTAPGGNPDIHVSSKNSNGQWLPAIGLSNAINTPAIEDNPHLSANQDAIWFSSDRTGGYGKKDLYFSYKQGDGAWATPTNLGPAINTGAEEDQPWADPLSNWFYFSREGKIFRSEYVNGTFSTPTEFAIPGQAYVAEISFTDDGKHAFFVASDAINQRIRIMQIIRQANGDWGPATPVD